MDTTELRGQLDEEGRLLRYPTKYKKRLYAILYLAEKLEPGRVYTEAEVNLVIGGWLAYNDPAVWRRDLIDHKLLERDRAGREYRRVDALPTEKDFIALWA